jgi:hypothetical protein
VKPAALRHVPVARTPLLGFLPPAVRGVIAAVLLGLNTLL